ncbi:MAG: DUF1837 domain-containing protein [Mucilaginibacter sp.]
MIQNQAEQIGLEDGFDVSEDSYNALIDVIHQDIKVNERVDASFHFLKYHDCIDREGDFLKSLRKHLVYYCFPKARYKGKTVDEITELVFEGRDKFFNAKDSANGRKGSSRSGELGEIALYFLLESYLKAPQIISKMSLKTTQGENFKGSDGIHLGIQGDKKCIFYCESKLNKKRDAAFDDCVKSVLDFQGKKKDFEISIINNHIDVSNAELREAIIEFLDPTKPKGDDWLEVHACFIGFNWDKFVDIETCLPNDKLMGELKKQLTAEISVMKDYLNKKIVYPSIKQRFFFFVMPFKDIDTLRTTFLTLLYGNK